MEVLLDNKPYAAPLDGATLQDILCDLMNNHLGGARTLKEVKIDGRPFEYAAMGQPVDILRDQIGCLEIETLDAREVAMHFLRQADGYLRTIALSSEKVAELFRIGDERETNEHYLRTLDSLQLFMQVLSTTQDTLSLDFNCALADGTWPELHLERLSALVQEMLTAQEQEDWILLADLLQYDLVSALASWREIIPQISRGVLS
jgi:hypothetical protein